MNTTHNMADSLKPSSLLEQLREKSEALRAKDHASRKPMEEAIKDIDRILWRTFRWLDEAMGHLEVIHPRVNHVFRLGSILSVERPHFDRGFVSFRRRSMVGMEVLEHVELFYKLQGDKPMALRLNTAASTGVEERLRSSSMPYHYQTEQDEKRVVKYGLFQVQPQISASVRFTPDYHHQMVLVTLHNVDRFEAVSLDFSPERLNEAALEDLLKLMMGEPSGFLRRAPLALIRGRQDEPSAALAPVAAKHA